MMAEINYGVSDAARAGQAAQVYETNSAQTIANMEQQYKDKVSELASAIVSGYTDQEKKILEKQVQDLGNRYSQAIAATQGQFAFAQQQATTVADESQRQFEELAARQRQQASQAVGGVSARFTPGMITASQEDAINAARDQGMAGAEFNIGMQGVAGTARSLYAQALEAQKAASRAQLEGSRVNLQTALEARALQAAYDREQKERDRLREFELTGFNAVLAAKAERDNKIAELLAAAAGADTRTEKDKALAELDLYKKKADVDLKNQLKVIGAQAKATGATQVSQAVSDAEADVLGSSSAFGQNLANAIANRPQGRPANAVEMVAKGNVPRMYGIKGIPGILYMSGSNMLVHEQDVKDPTKTAYYDLTNLNRLLNTTSGYLQSQKLSKEQQLLAVRRMLQATTPQEKIAIQYLFGFDTPELLLVALKPLPGAKVSVSTSSKVSAPKDTDRDGIPDSIDATPNGGSRSQTPNQRPNPTPNPSPTPKK